MIKERILQVVEYKGIKKEEFYQKIGMSSANFRGKAKETPINSNAIANILTCIPEINLLWLITGEGKMFNNIDDSTNNFKSIDLKTINTLLGLFEKNILNTEEKMALKDVLNCLKSDLNTISYKLDSLL